VDVSASGPQRGAPDPAGAGQPGGDLAGLLGLVARGDQAAFRDVYDRAAGQVLGVARRVVRDPAQSEEVMQEVLLEVWRTAARFDPAAGSSTARPSASCGPRRCRSTTTT
jgi:RNA polymerase sigma-70 factor (ECF subfamily)